MAALSIMQGTIAKLQPPLRFFAVHPLRRYTFYIHKILTLLL